MHFKMLRRDSQFPIKVLFTALLLTFSADGKPTSSPSVDPDQVTGEEVINENKTVTSPPPSGEPPKIVDSKQSVDLATGLIILTCYYESDSRTTFSWLKNGEPWNPPYQSEGLTTNPRTIGATNIPETWNQTIYTCVVKNEAGTASSSFLVKRDHFFANFFRSLTLNRMVRH